MAVATKKEGTSNGDSKAQIEPRGRPTAAWSCTELKDSYFRWRWQTSADTLGGNICLDEGSRIVPILEIAGCNVWCSADPDSRRTEQRVAVFDRLGHQMTESAQASCSQLPESPRHFLEQTLRAPLSPGPPIRRPWRHDHQSRNAVIIARPAIRGVKHVRVMPGAVRPAVGFVA